MYTRKLHVKYTDGIDADVRNVNISYTFEGVLGGFFSAGTNNHISEYWERRDQIEAGLIKGFYCFEPELIDEIYYELVFKEGGSVHDAEWVSHVKGKCFKDNKLSATLSVSDAINRYTEALSGLPELVSKEETDRFEERFWDWYDKKNVVPEIDTFLPEEEEVIFTHKTNIGFAIYPYICITYHTRLCL